jgi:tetratricopeptide (TPR) repeat protein
VGHCRTRRALRPEPEDAARDRSPSHPFLRASRYAGEMALTATRIEAPRDEEVFSDWCVHIYRQKLACPDLKKLGRRGQRQGGVDLLGNDANGDLHGIQCKLRNDSPLKPSDITADIKKARESHSSLTRLEFVTTARRDTQLTQLVLQIDRKHKKAKRFRVAISFWEDIEEYLNAEPTLRARLSGGIEINNPDAFESRLAARLSRTIAVSASLDRPGKVDASIKHALKEANRLAKRGEVDKGIWLLLGEHKAKWKRLGKRPRFDLARALGNAYYLNGDTENAACWFLRAKRLHRGMESSVLEARAYQFQGKNSRASALAEKILLDTPGSLAAHSIRISCSPLPYLDVLEATPPSARKNTEIALALSFRAVDACDLPAAIAHGRAALRGAGRWLAPSVQLGALLIMSERHSAEIGPNNQPIVTNAGRIREAVRLCSTVLDRHTGVNTYLRTLALYNRSSAYKLLGRRKEGMADLEHALRLDPTDRQMRATLAASLDMAGNTTLAIEELEKVLKTRDESVGPELLCAVILARRRAPGDVARAVGVLDGVKRRLGKEADQQLRAEFVRILGELRHQLDPEGYSPQRSPVEDLLSSVSDDYSVILRARWLAEYEMRVEAARMLEPLVQCARQVRPPRLLLQWLADACLKSGEPQWVVDIMRPSLRVDHVSQTTLQFLAAANEAEDHGAIMALAERLRQNGRSHRDVRLTEIQLRHAYDEGDAYSLARDWIREHPDDTDAWIICGNISVDESNDAAVSACLQHLSALHRIEKHQLPGVVRLLKRATSDNYAGRLRFMHKVWRHNRGESGAWMGLIAMAFLAEPEEVMDLPKPTLAGDGMTVTVAIDGETEYFSLERGDGVDIAWDEYPADGEVASAVRGRTVGAQVALPGPFTPRTGVITGLMHTAVFAADRCRSRWARAFPELPFIQSFDASGLTEGASPEAREKALEPMRQMATKKREHSERVLKAYREQIMTVWQVSRELHLSHCEAIEALVFSSAVGYKSNNGWTDLKEQEAALGRASGVIADVTALASLVRLELPTRWTARVRVLVPRRLRHELIVEREERVGSPRGHVSGACGLTGEVRPGGGSDAQESLSDRVCALAATLAVAGGESSGRDLANILARERKALERDVGPTSARAAAYATKHGIPLLTDDLGVAMHAQNVLGVSRASSVAFIEFLHTNGVISSRDRALAMCQFHQWRYLGVPIDADIILMALERGQWSPYAPLVVRICGDLADNADAGEFIARTYAVVARRIWRDERIGISPNDVLAGLLLMLNKRLDRRNIAVVMERMVDTVFGLDAIAVHEVRVVMRAWIKSTTRVDQ